MAATRVKVCGITSREDAEIALAEGADFIGINLYAKSPRYVRPEDVPSILEAIPPGKRVLVDVSTPTDQLERYLALEFDYYQLHFDLEVSVATVAAWSGLVGQHALWVAPRIPADEPHFPQVLMEFADTVLLDSYHPGYFGGSGISGQNWQKFSDFSLLYQHKHWILAGGLNPDNIQEAIRFTGAEMVDVNSGVESSPGKKDVQKLQRFFSAVKAGPAF